MMNCNIIKDWAENYLNEYLVEQSPVSRQVFQIIYHPPLQVVRAVRQAQVPGHGAVQEPDLHRGPAHALPPHLPHPILQRGEVLRGSLICGLAPAVCSVNKCKIFYLTSRKRNVILEGKRQRSKTNKSLNFKFIGDGNKISSSSCVYRRTVKKLSLLKHQ